MITKFLSKAVGCFLLCMLLTNISLATDPRKIPPGRRCSMVEKWILRDLGLAEDVNDTVIIQLLDAPIDKRLRAISLVRYRKISSAEPKLLQIFNSDNNNEIFWLEKIVVAEALCDFGNKEWMPTIKALIEDPNSILNRGGLSESGKIAHKIDAAGLLARAGDYSQFEIVANGIGSSEKPIRSKAIHALGNFGHKTNPITGSAVELLTSVATSDSIPWLRERAIDSMEKIAKKKPEVEPKIIAALEANKDSSDEDLRRMCNAMLDSYNKKLKEEKSK